MDYSKVHELTTFLESFIPKQIIPFIAAILVHEGLSLKVTHARTSKLGDYVMDSINGPRITVNGDLNPYSFLITLVHEIAHHKAFKIYGHRIKPHGKEWKHTYAQLMRYIIAKAVFPNDITLALVRHMKNAKASSVRDIGLRKALANYDENPKVFLSDIGINIAFQTINGQQFIALEKRRTRYRCRSLQNGNIYLVPGNAEVELLG